MKKKIVIDEKLGMVFESEEELEKFFDGPMSMLEAEYQALRHDDDFTDEEQVKLESEHFEETMDAPDEVWFDDKTFQELPIHTFVRSFDHFYYVCVAYVSSDTHEPTFVFTHFPTKSTELVEGFRRGDLIYSRVHEEILPAATDGDALTDADPLAIGLFQSMMKVRSNKDIELKDFAKYFDQRELTIEAPDEIWRKPDLHGNVLVTFIREIPDQPVKDLHYVAVTIEDETTSMHALLFSFPTTDTSLVERYRQGENLQAEEIVQESSH